MNTLPQYPSIKSWAAMKTAVLVSAKTTPPRDRVKGCSSTCECSNTRVPKTVPSWERTSHSLAYLSYPVSLEDTIAEKVYVPLLSIAVALKTCTQPAAPVIWARTERRRPSTRIVTQDHEGEILVIVSLKCVNYLLDRNIFRLRALLVQRPPQPTVSYSAFVFAL